MPFTSTNPATGRLIAEHHTHTRRQVEMIVARAHLTFERWRNRPATERAAALRAISASLKKRQDELAGLISAEMGKPLPQARAEVLKSALACEFYAKHGAKLLSPRRPPEAAQRTQVAFEPLGAVLAIMPWNFPVWQTVRAAAPALMAGNTFLLKPAPITAGCGLLLEDIFKTTHAEGLMQTVLVEPDAVKTLVADPRIAGVTLTGSTRAGQAVAALAGAAMKPAAFELGGSDAYLILDDADLELAADVCVQSRLINSGQSCVAAKRFVVVRRQRRAFERLMVEKLAAQRVGSPDDPATTIGPLARADLRAQLDAQVRSSIRRGARVLLKGGRLPGPGFFYAPVVLTDVAAGMPAYDDELFGPVASIIPVDDEADAIAVANGSVYGLGAAVFTRDRQRGLRVARQLQAGCVGINELVRSDPALPFGGIKQSGYGRELGEWGLHAFVNVKTIFG